MHIQIKKREKNKQQNQMQINHDLISVTLFTYQSYFLLFMCA
jgi:hypothetical protein